MSVPFFQIGRFFPWTSNRIESTLRMAQPQIRNNIARNLLMTP